MDFNRQNIQSKVRTAETHVIDEGLRAYMLKVYNYMTTGLLLTGIIAFFFGKASIVTGDAGQIIGVTSIGALLFGFLFKSYFMNQNF